MFVGWAWGLWEIRALESRSATTELEAKNNKMDIKLQSGIAAKEKNGILHSRCSGRTWQSEHDCNSILNFLAIFQKLLSVLSCIMNYLSFPTSEINSHLLN